MPHSNVRCLSAVIGLALLVPGEPVSAQFGGQYPPTTYPPGTYPPGSYPDNYPSNRYPARIPGGGTVGIPIPEIKLPKRGSKDKSKDKEAAKAEPANAPAARPEAELRAVTGKLRRLGDRDLLLEIENKGIYRFRVLSKTQFRDSKGEPMRDSLLKPGDQIAVQFNPVDEETILYVRLVRAGTAEERAAAAQPVADSAAKVPEELESEPVSAPAAAADPSEFPAEKRPVLRRRSDPDAITETVMPKSDSVIEGAREQAAGINESLPNFVVQQHTTRFASFTKPPTWQAVDVVTAEVAYVNGTEEYRNISINGRPAKREVQETGSWSTGEFATTLQDILSPITGAAFTRRAEQTVGGRGAVVYDLLVPQSRSHWRIIAQDGTGYQPAYKGTIWIDKQTNHVLKVEQHSISMPDDFQFESASWIVEYDAVRIDSGKFMLPVRAENWTCARSSGQCSRNEIYFRNYRKFSAESDIKYDKFRTALESPSASGQRAGVP